MTRRYAPALRATGLTLAWAGAFAAAVLIWAQVDMARDPLWWSVASAIGALALIAVGIWRFVRAIMDSEGRLGLAVLLTLAAMVAIAYYGWIAIRPNVICIFLAIAWLIVFCAALSWLHWINRKWPPVTVGRPRVRLERLMPPSRGREQ